VSYGSFFLLHGSETLVVFRGDSWRARVSHICDLQVNICNGMKINFGGLDGWDYAERRRNLEEVHMPME
jgi:hypothetical protein